jgi:large subunit ribosomal protein L30e
MPRRSPLSWRKNTFPTAKLIIAANCPPLRKSEIKYYAMLSKTSVHHFQGTNLSLGTATGKLFHVRWANTVANDFHYFLLLTFQLPASSVMIITDQGDSDLLNIAESNQA